jgi:FkbM family methyltransferase
MNFQPAKYVINRFILQRKSLIAPTAHFDLSLRVRTEDVVGRHLYKYGAHEPATTEYLKEHLQLRDGDVVLDVGANIGWYSLIFDRIASSKSVDIFAFEPDPTNYALLCENVSRNSADHVHTQQLAVADVEDTLQLHLYGKSNLGRHSLLDIHEGETVDVQTVILDRFWVAQGLGDRTPRFIKMDIEGFELMALRGAANVLSRCPMVMLEYSPGYMTAASITPAELIDLMLSHGFLANVLEDGALVPQDADVLKASERHIDLFWTK